MPRGGKCNHPNCYGEPCKQLTDEELIPTERDFKFARALIDRAYFSVSNKYRLVARVKDTFPEIQDLLRPEVVDTEEGRLVAEMWERHRRQMLRNIYSPHIDTKELTLKEYKAFRQLGGQTA